MGRIDETEALFRESYERSRRDLGDRDPQTISCLNSLASFLHRSGKLEEAEPLSREALASSRAVLGDEHMTTLILINNLARLHRDRGELAEAEVLYRESLAAFQRSYGADHPNTLMAMNNLGMLLQAQRKLSEAEQMMRQGLEGRRRVLPPEHVHLMHSLAALAGVIAAQGRDADAEPLYAELCTRCPQAQLRPEEAARFMSGWGPCLVRLERYDQAETPLLEARRRLLDTGQNRSGSMRQVVTALAELCDRTGRAAEAQQWRTELAALRPGTTRPAPATSDGAGVAR
jgi:tetratricopeptide (TPR) repeat protein